MPCRDRQSIDVLAFGYQFQAWAEIGDLIDAGADRVTIRLNNTGGEAAIDEIEEIAAAVL